MVSLTLLLLSSGGGTGLIYSTASTAGLPLLGVAALLTILSLADYLKGLWRYL